MTAPGALPPWDDGLQNERTTLAWTRTAMSLLVTGALLARQTERSTLAVGVLALTGVTSTAMLIGGERRYCGRSHRLRHGDPVVSSRQLMATAVLVMTFSAFGAAMILA